MKTNLKKNLKTNLNEYLTKLIEARAFAVAKALDLENESLNLEIDRVKKMLFQINETQKMATI